MFLTQIVDPATRSTGFHDDHIDLVVLKDCRQVASCRCRRLEAMFLCVRIKKAAHRVELTEVDCENVHVRNLRGLGVEIVTSEPVSPDHRPESANITDSAPNHGLTWIL